jgi:hypothetical protein
MELTQAKKWLSFVQLFGIFDYFNLKYFSKKVLKEHLNIKTRESHCVVLFYHYKRDVA